MCMCATCRYVSSCIWSSDDELVTKHAVVKGAERVGDKQAGALTALAIPRSNSHMRVETPFRLQKVGVRSVSPYRFQ